MPDRLRLILGVKLRALRQERGLGLKALAQKAGLSVSYLSEIEQGKKYPKPDKIVDLSVALGVPYDDLVSLRVDKGLGAVKEVIESPLLRGFPFDLFGVDAESVVRLLSPDKAGALVQAVGDVTRAYDARVEDLLLAALRAYQQMHANRFPDLEAAAERLRERLGIEGVPDAARLRGVLEREHGYRVETDTLPGHPELGAFRSVLSQGGAGPAGGAQAAGGAVLHVNGALRDEQLAFLYARELAFLELAPDDRPLASPWVRAERFGQVLANFEASYLAGALLLPAAEIDAVLLAQADAERWDPAAFLALLDRYRSTPEMLFHRLTQRVPEALGIDELYFLRFHHETTTDRVELTKTFNLSRVPVPHGVSAGEHYCRRWPALQALAALDARQRTAAGRGGTDDGPAVVAQRQHFVAGTAGDAEPADFFVLAVARPLSLRPGVNSAVSLGLRLTRATKRAVRFWDDPALPRLDVSLTCERCPIADCRVRAAPPTALREAEAEAGRRAALAAL
ncbi:helix-turn-helix transcriptional regulator [Rubrivirga sp. S365]|uniref:Helix-turn-helix transcriptional regulator n=1 Tax=Rubrivirga litoralis TaxID=3075598 RepID=A0ABU3BQI2_9BACT|nr:MULTISPECIES: helix-turn-helix transcriptional regulator [unclassified Rubrivirga]MDT0631538.1 helix-turn-helix transcriptional regulator [Rubrivirga sp. F394]MDT7855479.1 helix-turn-helix transcriptional regulator [Rubrivirga sp. S365]